MLLALFLGVVQASSRVGGLAGPALVYSARERAVLLIGGEALGRRPICRLDETGWVPIAGSELPARTLPAVAADEQGNVLVHGGGLCVEQPDGSIDFHVTAETWRWDGAAWKLVATDGPAPRDHHCMVFDSHRSAFVLFGGSDADPSGRSILYGDTWEWRSDEWELASETGPSPRAHHAMAFDPIRQRTVMVGGSADDSTWEWDGAKWEAVAKGPPAGRTSPRLSWDPKGARVILFGGESGSSSPRDTWSWNGKSWSVLATSGPPGRVVHAMTFDEARGAAILFGGANREGVLGDLWQFSADAWTRRVL